MRMISLTYFLILAFTALNIVASLSAMDYFHLSAHARSDIPHSITELLIDAADETTPAFKTAPQKSALSRLFRTACSTIAQKAEDVRSLLSETSTRPPHRFYPDITITIRHSDDDSEVQKKHNALSMSAANGNVLVVKELLRAYSAREDLDINDYDSVGNTPLIQAIRNYHAMSGASLYLDVPISPCQRGQEDFPQAIVQAKRMHKHEIVCLFLSMPGIDVNRRNRWASTALMHAALYDQQEIVQTLLAVPTIDITLKTSDGRTALAIAQEFGRTAIVTMLKQHAISHPDIMVKPACAS